MSYSIKTKLETVAYLIAGLSPIDAARKVAISQRITQPSLSAISRWQTDKTIRCRAMNVYCRAVTHARENRGALFAKRQQQITSPFVVSEGPTVYDLQAKYAKR